MSRIATRRLQLVPATLELVRAALAGPPELGTALGAVVPATWPPQFLDPPALEYTRARLLEGPEQFDWWLYFVLLAEDAGARTLVGTAGYKGPPSADGTVEIGYGIVAEHQRRGYAAEAALGLVERAFANPGVERVLAETLPDLTASIGVLEKCGFRLTGAGSEPGVIRFELTRAAHAARGRGT